MLTGLFHMNILMLRVKSKPTLCCMCNALEMPVCFFLFVLSKFLELFSQR